MGEGEKTDAPAASGDLEYGDRAPSSLRSRRSSAWQPLAGGFSGFQRRGSEAVQTITEVGHESVVELNHNIVPVQTVPVGKKTSTEDFISPTTDRLNSLSIGPEFSSIEMLRSAGWIHEDGIKRSGNTWTASGHIITAVIGAGVLALPYAMASLGWILGAICFVFFAWVTLFTAQLLADLYIIDGVRQRTFPQMVRTVMGVPGMIALGIIQQANLVLTALAYTITAAQSMKDMADLSCGGESGCFNHQWAMGVMFGGVQLFLSQVPTLESFWLASIIGAIMSFGYSFIALGLTIAYHGTEGGIKPMTEGLTSAQQAWNILNSIGTIEFAYSFSIILLEIQDTLSNAEGKATGPITKMKRAVNISVAVMTGFYISIACAGFASLGYNMQGYILTDYIGIAPNWVLYMANAMVIAHLVAAYQVWSQPHFALVEDWMENKVCKDVKNPTLRWMTRGFGLRLLYRSFYVVIVTFLAVLLPFFQSVLGFVGALGFWPMTVFFPVNCWIRVFRPGKAYRIFLRILDVVCFVITVAVIVASVESMIEAAKNATLFA
jgi:amino acid permease